MALNNPALSEKAFSDFKESDFRAGAMTVGGTVGKTMVLLALLMVAAVYTWYLYYQGQDVTGFLIVGLIGSLVTSLITIFFKKAAFITAPLYVILNGLMLGAISAWTDYSYPGIVINAILITVGTLFLMLAIYTLRIIKVTPGFTLGIVICTASIALVYLIDIILGFFGISVPFIHETGWIGIGISLFIVAIAALNLLLDFHFIETEAQSGAPKYMEWYAAFGLMVTLIWLYMEILRLLSKLNSRN